MECSTMRPRSVFLPACFVFAFELTLPAVASAVRACAECNDGSSAVSFVPGMSCDDLQARLCADAGGINPGTFVCPCRLEGRAERNCQRAISKFAIKLACAKLARFAKCLNEELSGEPCDPVPKVEALMDKLEAKVIAACQDADLSRLGDGSCAREALETVPTEFVALQLASCVRETHLAATDNLTRAQFGGGGMCAFTCGDGTSICGNTASAQWCQTRAARRCRGQVAASNFDPVKACPADCPAGAAVECD